jgi:hypothetical protein
MKDGQKSNIEHDSSQRWPDDSITHRCDKEHEEAQRVPRGVEHGDEDEERSCDTRVSNVVEVHVVSPDSQHLKDKEDDGSGDVVLNREELAAVAVAEGDPDEREGGVGAEKDGVELPPRTRVSLIALFPKQERLTKTLGYSPAGR